VLLFQKTFDIIAILTVITLSTVISLMLSKKSIKISWWDYAFPYLGVPFWFVLQACGIGGEVSSSNFMVEMFAILVCSVSAPWLRFALTYVRGRIVAWISILLTISPLAVAAFVRLVTPVLPS
jgi:hypothetical protein